MALTEYDIQHITQKAIKGSILSDYLAKHPLKDYQSMHFEFPDEDIMLIRDCNIPDSEEGPEFGSRWTLVFDGASNTHDNGIGAIINSPTNFHLLFTTRLCFECTNNMVEYESYIFGIEDTIDLRIKILEVYGDSTLVISQIKGDRETRDHKLILYKDHVLKLVPYFDKITFHHIPREENQLADALATFASMFKVKWKNEVSSFHLNYLDEPAYCLAAEDEVDGYRWYYDIMRLLECQEYPKDTSITDKKYLRKLSSKFFLSGRVLYKRNYDSVLLRCVNKQEENQIIMEIHEGSFGTHVSGHTMVNKILRVDYYWMTMEFDCHCHIQTCHKCQIYADKIHLPPMPLNVLSSSWPVAMQVRTSTRATPFSLVYGMDAVFPVEVEIPSLRILTDVKLDETEWVEARFNQLKLIDEKCLTTICHDQIYQKRIKREHDKKFFPRSLEVRYLILKKIMPTHIDPRGKWTPNYEGPYVVRKVFFERALILATVDGETFHLL
ncbi:uncharacterized protein LOC127096100 [Lathyrus oleraceus]|uniref:uncharacterized protein LOC127096100 n=1 Tax=Pisum sativum TaxID=3888 RepID=UPI0021D22065|nr:uncharacterized protein LOC127096100 [Pisum sativum]